MDGFKIINYFKCVTATLLLLLAGCNNDAAPECFTATGTAVNYNMEVPEFTAIHVSAGIELVVVEADEQSLTIATGENIKEYITAEVIDGTLWLTNANNCNWVHIYNTTTITVATPNLEKIFTATQFAVRSQGVLHFPSLSIQSGLISETSSGTVNLNVDSQLFTVEDNQNLYCILSGYVENLTVNFYSGDARFDGTALNSKNVEVFHRSSNDIIVRAENQVTGTINSTGNLVLLNHPPVVDVQQVYTGRVVYE
ncbi:head GIN domain-containing protein [Flavobacterium rhizosphaerae]|uniref:Head GIN domain-containing protein n=1 Tax=Flavobacterium rhizosphaerae TaxID=3163298 RepID=A0ABW8YRW3_9FLAO